MEESTIFSILEIQRTKDKETIKQAYRKLLIKTNPEDNPDGFKRLRQAYEEACAYADREEEKSDDTLVGRFLEKVQEVYRSFSKRMNPECWRELLRDDVLVDLETAEEAKLVLFSFLMEHFRLKPEIFSILDEAFGIRENREEFYERFPKNFVDFMAAQCEGAESFPFDLLEGADQADYDLALSRYYEIINDINKNQMDNIPKLIEEMEATEVSHPYLSLAKIRYWYVIQEKERAMKEFLSIYEQYPELPLCISYGAQLFWEDGQKERAVELYEKLLFKDKKQYLPNKNMAEYYYEKEDYERAKDYCEDAIRINDQEEDLIQLLHAINQRLVSEYEEEQRKNTSDFQKYLPLAWCYLQEEEMERCFGYLMEKVPDSYKNSEYYDLLARVYMLREQYELAVDCFQQELTLLEEERKTASEETLKKSIERSAAANSRMAQIYVELSTTKADQYELAMKAVESAIELMPGGIGYLLQKADIAIKKKDYALAKKTCDEILELDRNAFWAYVKKQEAAFEQGDDQEVIDLFYSIKNLFPGYSKSYSYAVQTFLRYNQYKDAQNILEQAESVELSDPEIELATVMLIRQRAQTEGEGSVEEAWQRIKELCEKLGDKEEKDKILCANVYLEKARCENALNQNQEAFFSVEKAISLNPGDDFFLWVMGIILKDLGRYEEAVSVLKRCERTYQNSERLQLHIARCYYKLMSQNPEMREKAIAAYERLSILNPQNIEAYEALTEIYQEMLGETGNLEYYKKGLFYADRQIELQKNVDTYNDRGRMHMAANELEKAKCDYEEAENYDPSNPHVINNMGCIFQYTDQEEKAAAHFKKAILLLKAETHPGNRIFLGNLGKSMLRLSRYPEAIGIYSRIEKNFGLTEYQHELLMSAYRKMKRFDEAETLLQKRYGSDLQKLQKKRAAFYWEAGQYERMKPICKWIIRHTKSTQDKGEVYQYLAGRAMYGRGKVWSAYFLLKKAFKNVDEKSKTYSSLLLFLMEVCYVLKRKKDIQQYYNLLENMYEREYLGEQGYLDQLMDRMQHLYDIGIINLYQGNIEKAKDHLKQMEGCYKCRGCVLLHCSKYQRLKGMIAEQEGDYALAQKCYQNGLEIDEEDAFFRYRVKKER